MGNIDTEKVKEETNRYILNYYKDNGLNKTLSLAKSAINLNSVSRLDSDFKNNYKGELCESVLEICIIDFIRNNPDKTKGWFYEKGLILKDLDNSDSNYYTELDIVLFTQYKALVFECKSYDGDKTIEPTCLIKRPFDQKGKDVYTQNFNHAKQLMKHVKSQYNNSNKSSSPLMLIYFDFSKGTFIDTRTKLYKKMMPCVSLLNINKLLETMSKKKHCWNLNEVQEIMKIVNKNKKSNTLKQREFVKSLG